MMRPWQSELHDTAARALALMRGPGFRGAQVGASVTRRDEVNIAHDEPSLLRSTETRKVSLLGLVDGRKASAELSEFDDASLDARIASLFDAASSAPRDEANAVSALQRASIEQGPQQSDVTRLADTVRELLDFRARDTPAFRLEEGYAAHTLLQGLTLTTGGSELWCSAGWYSISVFGSAREGGRVSSFNYAGGDAHELSGAATERFGIGEMMRDTVRQIDARGIGAHFTGDVVLTPNAVSDLLAWLQGQLADVQLIAGSSLYRDKVGTTIASPLLSLSSRFDAPGVVAISADAFVTPPVEIVRDGKLLALTPSLYGSRKTGLPHVPVANGWQIATGDTPRARLIESVARGALVGRLSMGMPAANGDFSGVIKNSFAIEGGRIGHALSETMIAGNMAQMLRDIVAQSRERLDTGALLLPWLRIGGLHFS